MDSSPPVAEPGLRARIRLAHLVLIACTAPAAIACAADAAPAPTRFGVLDATPGEVRILAPQAPPRVVTERVDTLGRAVTVGCATCHSQAGVSRPEHRVGEAPVAFHGGLQVDHGARVGLVCTSCHAGPDYAGLHLADGRAVPYVEVIQLCRQCHGPQARDFDHGAHGGMNGHWDLRYGDQLRHACTTCHDPHSPAYAPMWPARPPGDARWGGSHDGARPHDDPEDP